MDHRGDTDTHLRHAKFGIMGGNPEIAGGGDFEAAAEAPAGKPRDHGRRKMPYRFTEVTQPRDEGFGGFLIEFCHFLDVGAADHALLALAGEDDRANAPGRRQAFSNPSRIPSVTADERMLSEPALQMERRTTPRSSRVDPAVGIEHFHFVFPDLFRRLTPLPGHCAGLSRAGGRGALRGGARRYKMIIII